ncbi:hypothetical protein [Pseudomonas frederiksbergensis]|uniref:hypothetical protein n=1 Tax=Pseudomonas frederiksbergensis TaxID=104087 RepID=UPI003D22283B
MVCHSNEFTLAILRDKPYFHRLANHLIDQILELSCDDFARLMRAVDAVESGAPTTKFPGDFKSHGVLAGYGHFHYRRNDWAATNLALTQGMPVDQSLDQTIDTLAQKIVEDGTNPSAGVDAAMKKFIKRIPQATGDWVLYRDGAIGREYLALHEHTVPGAVEEQELKKLLDSLAV